MKWDENAQTFKVEGLTEGINDGDVGLMGQAVGQGRDSFDFSSSHIVTFEIR